MDENIKNILDELKRENDNLKQKLTQIEDSINKTEPTIQENIPQMEEKESIFDVEAKEIEQIHVCEPNAVNNNISVEQAGNIVPQERKKSRMAGFLLIAGVALMFMSPFIGILFLIGGLAEMSNASNKKTDQPVTKEISFNNSQMSSADKRQSFELSVGIK